METEQAIIFCNTNQKSDWLARKMRENEKGLEVCSVVSSDMKIFLCFGGFPIFCPGQTDVYTNLCRIFDFCKKVMDFCKTFWNMSDFLFILIQLNVTNICFYIFQHGGRQNREHLMTLFTAGVCRVLITTDFITRANFKVKPVPLVLNYEFPELPENYTQRITCAGRTRTRSSSVQNPVLVFSFVTAENLPVLESLATKFNFTVTPMSTQNS